MKKFFYRFWQRKTKDFLWCKWAKTSTRITAESRGVTRWNKDNSNQKQHRFNVNF